MVAIDQSHRRNQSHGWRYSFDESKFNRATQAQRQVVLSFKIYVYSARWKRDHSLDRSWTRHLRHERPASHTRRTITMKNLKA